MFVRAKWAILAQLWPKNYASLHPGSTARIFPKNLYLSQMDNFDPIVAQNVCKLMSRICSKVFFQTLQHDRVQYVDKNHLSEISPKNVYIYQMGNFGPIVAQKLCKFISRIYCKNFPKKSLFEPNGQFWPCCGSNLWKLISRVCSKVFFQISSMVGHS